MNRTAQRFDAIVVGGGPAGSAAATVLASSGRHVLVLERQLFPRFHIGESLLPESNRLFDRLGVGDQIRDEGFVVKRGASFVTGDGECASDIDFADSREVTEAVTYQVPRARLDELLLRHAEDSGAEVVEEAPVEALELHDDGVRVRYDRAGRRRTAEAEYLVDASGQSGLLARRLDLRRVDPQLRNVAIHAWFEGVPRPAGPRSGDIRIVSLDDLGWIWLIPIDDRVTSVGLVAPRDRVHRGEGGLEAALERVPVLKPLLSEARRVTKVRRDADYSYRVSRYAGDRWLLAGDAGSFLDPVFSSGVYLALESGIEAGEAVDRALRGNRPRRVRFAAFDRRQRRRYRFFRRFASGFYDPAFRDLFFARDDRWRLRPAIIAALAGVWRPTLATRIRLAFFFACVHLQRRVAIAPRLHSTEGLATPSADSTRPTTDLGPGHPASR